MEGRHDGSEPPPIVRIVRTYPQRSSLPWLHVLLETLHDIGTAGTLDDLGRSVGVRGGDLFGAIPAVAVVLRDDADGGWRRLPSASAAHLPEFVSMDDPGTTYVPGQIVTADDMVAYAAARPTVKPWVAAGVGAFVAAAFGPRERSAGYVVFFLKQRADFSDDELTLLAIVANAVGLAVDRIRGAR